MKVDRVSIHKISCSAYSIDYDLVPHFNDLSGSKIQKVRIILWAKAGR